MIRKYTVLAAKMWNRTYRWTVHSNDCVMGIVYLHRLFLNYTNDLIIWLMSWPISLSNMMSFQKEVLTFWNLLVPFQDETPYFHNCEIIDVNKQNRDFRKKTQIWHFCTKLALGCLKKLQQNMKWPSVGIDLTTDHHWFRSLTVLICQALPVSDFQILTKSCSIESGNNPNPKCEVVHETTSV